MHPILLLKYGTVNFSFTHFPVVMVLPGSFYPEFEKKIQAQIKPLEDKSKNLTQHDNSAT